MIAAPILVTYASRAGSTAGVARAIGDCFRDYGALVAVCSIRSVQDLKPYRAVVIGSAIQEKQWLPEAVTFVTDHQPLLQSKATAIFTVCMTLAMHDGKRLRKQVAAWVRPISRLVRPVSEGYFAGMLDLHKVPARGDRLKLRLSILLGNWRAGDHRNWGAIQAWSDAVYPLLTFPAPAARSASTMMDRGWSIISE